MQQVVQKFQVIELLIKNEYIKKYIIAFSIFDSSLLSDMFHASNRRHDDRSAVSVAYVVGDDEYRSVLSALLRANNGI